MVSGEKANRLEKNIKNVSELIFKAERNLNTALDRNSTSLKAQQREVQRILHELSKNKNTAILALENLNFKARRAVNANERARIEKEKIKHKVVLKQWRSKKALANAEFAKSMNLASAMNLRRKILKRKLTEEKARSIIGNAMSRTIIPRTLYGPYGTRTLNGMRRFPGYKEPTLENYAKMRREINRLKRTLK